MKLGLEMRPDMLDVADEYDIRGVTLFAHQLINDGLEKTLQPLRKKNLSACQVMAFGYNPLDQDHGKLARARADVLKMIQMIPDAGNPPLVLAGGNYNNNIFGVVDPRNFTDKALEDAAGELKKITAQAEKYGVTLSLKPYLKTVLSTPRRFLELRERVASPNLKICCDIVNFYKYDDVLDPLPLARDVCDTLAGHFGTATIKDVKLNAGFHINIGLAPLSEGVTDWSRVLPLIDKALPEDHWVILEHVTSVEEARESIAIVRAAMPQSEGSG